jgi:two-component system, sensor histidine kinase and response regulator
VQTDSVRVLLVEDNPGDARFLIEEVRDLQGVGEFDILQVPTLAAGLTCLAQGGVDVVLLDLGLPDSYGMGTVSAVSSRAPDVPIVVLTGVDDEQQAVEALQCGAQEYLVKGEARGRLVGRSIRHAIERKQAERVLREAHDELEARVQERTAELSAANAALLGEVAERQRAEDEIKRLNRDLERGMAELKAANAELEDYSHGIAHDLRAPLRAIDGFSQILLDDFAAQLTPEAQRYLGLTRASAQQMGRLIDDLLTFARLGRQPLRREHVLLDDLVRQVIEGVAVDRQERAVEIRSEALGTCEADPVQLRQVFANLLSNALKFTRDCHPAVIEISSRQQAGERVYFVRDNGVGFDMRYAGKLFGIFQRLHRSDQYEGTGVGLANVKRIIIRHGGRVWAEAEPNRGATFYFTLGTASSTTS